ncbi:hypothetical protein [Bacillus tuaregi]|uniref:hypothetical protein n=1 Tax=Bacillus tuaregi TaxID=1816695 RepID=UPI0008F91D11|nr:hypothetical protein [Bacillus tuaregi]
MYKYFTFTAKLTVLILFLCACTTQKESSQNKTNPYIKLSTEEQITIPDNYTKEQEQPMTESDSEQTEEKEQDPIPQVEKTLQAEEITDSLHSRPHTQIEPNKADHDMEKELEQLPFQDFKEKWNAISDDQLSELYIKQLNEKVEKDKTIYSATLNKDHQLNIQVQEGNIHQIAFVTSNPSSSSAVYSMLSGWGQIILLLHPEVQMFDVDDFFYQIGVRPNADLQNVKNTTMTYENIKYTITRTDRGFNFTAIITDEI